MKMPGTSYQAFFVVEKRFEISNLDLIRDMVSIVNLEMVVSE